MNRTAVANALLLAGCGTSGAVLPIQLTPPQAGMSEAPEVLADQSAFHDKLLCQDIDGRRVGISAGPTSAPEPTGRSTDARLRGCR
jgi:hypothetical protein